MPVQQSECNIMLLTPPEVEGRLKVSVRQLYYLIGRGEFPPPLKVGRKNRWRGNDVDRHLMGIEALSSKALDR